MPALMPTASFYLILYKVKDTLKSRNSCEHNHGRFAHQKTKKKDKL